MPRIVEPTTLNIDDAVQHWRDGRLVAFPTETVYGLGGDTFNVDAIHRIYQLKRRPSDNPLIAHVHHVEIVDQLTPDWGPAHANLAAAFWPGPLTLVLPRHERVPAESAGGRDTIAVRCPDHDVALSLLEQFGGPVSAPSANRFGHVSPTAARHVAEEFAEVEDLVIIDGGDCTVGIESTVLDMTTTPPRLLRPGSVSADQLREIIGDIDDRAVHHQDRSPGTRRHHYAPSVPTRLLTQHAVGTYLQQTRSRCAVIAIYAAADLPPHHHQLIRMPDDPLEYGRRLYDALRQAEHLAVDEIVIEQPQHTGGMWDAVLDRLQRASQVHE